MKNKVKDILGWVVCIVIAIVALGLTPYSIHTILLLVSAVCISPIVMKQISKRWKENKVKTSICAMISAFFMIAAIGVAPEQKVDDAFADLSEQITDVILHKGEQPRADNYIDKEDKIQSEVVAKTDSTLIVQFVDVGQADCILIQNDNKSMLIDAGNNADGDKLVKYFKSLGIKRFDVIVGTHPHEDHIGGLDNVISNFDIGKVYMPNVLTTTVTFEDVLDAIDRKNLKITAPKVNDTFELGDMKFSVLSVGSDRNELNSTSIVLKLDFYNSSFIFTGDAISDNEKTMLGKNIQSDVLKVRTSWLEK